MSEKLYLLILVSLTAICILILIYIVLRRRKNRPQEPDNDFVVEKEIIFVHTDEIIKTDL